MSPTVVTLYGAIGFLAGLIAFVAGHNIGYWRGYRRGAPVHQRPAVVDTDEPRMPISMGWGDDVDDEHESFAPEAPVRT